MKKSLITVNNVAINHIDWPISNPKASLIIVHGYAEHAARYDHVAQFFNDQGFSVRSYDLKGHGKSDGLTAYIDDFQEYVNNFEAIAKNFHKECSGVPHFVLGHSMGGLVVSIAAAQKKLDQDNKILLSNAGFDIVSNQPKALVLLIRLFAKLLPKIKTVKLDSEFISRDEKERKKYDNDPLNYRGGSKPGWVNQFDRAGGWMRNNAKLFTHPVMINYSPTDTVVHAQASEDFYNNIGSVDKTLEVYDGLYHELLNEIEKAEVMQKMLEWCQSQMQMQ